MLFQFSASTRLRRFFIFFLIFAPWVSSGFDSTTDSLRTELAKATHDTSRINLLIVLSDYYKENLVDYDTAKYFARQALKLAIKNNYQRGMGNAYREIAHVYRRSILTDSAFFYGQKALDIFVQIKDSSGIAWIYRHMGELHKQKQAYQQAEENFKRSLEISLSLGDVENTYWAYTYLGHLYELLGNYPEAFDYFDRGYGYSQKMDDSNIRINSLINLGVICTNMGNYLMSLDYYQQALSLSEKSKDSMAVSWCYNNIGTIFFYQKEYDEALKYYQLSLESQQTIHNEFAEANALNNIGEVYQIKGDTRRAISYFISAVNGFKTAYQRKNLGLIYLNIGKAYADETKYDTALTYYRSALRESEKYGYEEIISLSNVGMGEIYLKMDAYDKSKFYAQKAYSIATEISHPNAIKQSAFLLSQLSAKTQDYQKAYEYYVRFNDVEESLLNEQKIRELAQKEFEYEFEKEKEFQKAEQQKKEDQYRTGRKKAALVRNIMLISSGVLVLIIFLILRAYRINERSSQLLSAQKDEINKQAEELRAMNTMKDKFFSILSHDLRAPFSQIAGFIDILQSGYDHLSKEEMLEIVSLMKGSATNTQNLLDDLLIWAKNQQGHIKFSPQEIQLSEIAYQLSETYSQLLKTKHLQLVYDVDEKMMVEADKNMITTVLRNLISNAIKFTPEGGKIKLTATQDDANTLISVTDTGVGMPKDQLDSMFRLSDLYSSAGTHGEKGSGLGLILSKDFIDAHSGKISVTSEMAIGSIFTISIPNSQPSNSQSKL